VSFLEAQGLSACPMAISRAEAGSEEIVTLAPIVTDPAGSLVSSRALLGEA